MNSRRNFFRTALGVGAAGLAGSFNRFGLLNAAASATPSTSGYKALVCVFLYGGNDSNNMVIPVQSEYTAYSNIRKNLALAKAGLIPFDAATLSSANYGLHPNLSDLKTIGNNLALVANVGTLLEPINRDQFLHQQTAYPVPENLFSHADQQMQWQTSIPSGIATTGWAGRAADAVSHLNPATTTFPTYVSLAGNSIFGTGNTGHPGSVIPGAPIGLTGFDTSAAAVARKSALQNLLSFESGAKMIKEAETVMSNGLKDADSLNHALNGAQALTVAFPNTNLGQQLATVAKLIQARTILNMNRQIFFCSLGGFDTHTDQLNSQVKLYSTLGPALLAFWKEMDALGVSQDVTTFTESDFSRTMAPNSNGGTDHAWGSHHIVMGGAVHGGKLYGKFPTLALNTGDDSGGEGRWIPTTGVDQYGATLATWFGVDSSAIHTVFPNLSKFPTTNLGFLG